jgi:mono/diheme cytochrome c family protein
MRTGWLAVMVACAPMAEDETTAPDGTPLAADGPTWHGDVAPIYEGSCSGCHAPGGVGSPTWSTAEEVASWAPAIAASVAAGRMPPWRAGKGCNTYVDDFSLDDDAVQTFVDWADAGAPMGDPAEAARLRDPYEPVQLDTVDLFLEMPEPFTPSPPDGTSDAYRCFLLPWPYEDRVWVSGFEVVPGNLEVVHHAIPFIIGPDDVDAYLALDEADPGPGYDCYGGPGGDVRSLLSTSWLGAWAPGAGAAKTPLSSGIGVRPGSMVVMQLHYNVGVGTEPTPDQTALALQVEEERQGWAEIGLWMDPRWVLGLGMQIPAQTDEVTHTFEYRHGRGEGDYHLYSAALHLHELGKRAEIVVEHADGTETCVLREDAWDFNWQRSYFLEEPVHIADGDTVRVSCTWDNPTDQPVSWGDGTGDEMCLAMTLMAD